MRFDIRPEHLEAPDDVDLDVHVDVIEELGATSHLHGTLSSGETLVAKRRGGRDRAGGRATLRFRPEAARLFDLEGDRIR